MARDRPTLQKWLNSAGSAVGPLVGGLAGGAIGGAEGAIVGGVAGNFLAPPLLDELARHFPDRLTQVDGRWFRRVGDKLSFVTYSQYELLAQLRRDFAHSSIPSRTNILRDRDSATDKASLIGNATANFRNDARALDQRVSAISEREPLLADDDALRTLRQVKTALSISCQPVMPAILATLIDMRERLKIPLYIRHEDKSGVAQVHYMIERVHSGFPFDVAFVPNAAFLRAKHRGRAYDLSAHYAFATPVHYQDQHLVRRNHRNRYEGLNGLDYVRFLADGSAHEQYREINRRQSPRMREDQFTLSNYEKILQFADLNIAVALWEPISQYVLRSGKFVGIVRGDYSYWMSAFLGRDAFHDERFIRAFLNVFASAWCHCRANQSYAATLLEREAVLENFELAGRQILLGNA